MHRARAATSTIWSTVVFAGAMLGTPGCRHDAAPTTPAPVTEAPLAEPPPVPVEAAAPTSTVPNEMKDLERASLGLVEVRIESVPSGASVFRDGTRFGVTPLIVDVPKSDQATTWRIELDGYVTKEVTAEATADLVLQLVLAKAPVTPRVRGTTGKKTGRGFVLC